MDPIEPLVTAIEADPSSSVWLRSSVRVLFDADDAAAFHRDAVLIHQISSLRMKRIQAQRFDANPPPEEITKD